MHIVTQPFAERNRCALIAPSPSDYDFADRLAWQADGGDLDSYPGPGWATPAVEPSDPYLISQAWWSGFGQGADGFRLEVPGDLVAADLVASFEAGYHSGRGNFEGALLEAATATGEFVPGVDDEAEWLGWRLGAEGVQAELLTPDDIERAAFERGHDAGDAHLWTVDPLFAAHVHEVAQQVAGTDPERSFA